MTTHPTPETPATSAGVSAVPEETDMGDALLHGIRTGHMWLYLLMAITGALLGAALGALVLHLIRRDRG